jgi:hypothetical protein
MFNKEFGIAVGATVVGVVVGTLLLEGLGRVASAIGGALDKRKEASTKA